MEISPRIVYISLYNIQYGGSRLRGGVQPVTEA